MNLFKNEWISKMEQIKNFKKVVNFMRFKTKKVRRIITKTGDGREIFHFTNVINLMLVLLLDQ